MTRFLVLPFASFLTPMGCDDCDPPRFETNRDYDLTGADVDALSRGIPRDEITCSSACQLVVEPMIIAGEGGIDVEACTLDLDDPPAGSDTGTDLADVVVGTVHCEGTVVSYYCH